MGTTTSSSARWTAKALYHYERKLGTTTEWRIRMFPAALYHYERKLGTTTVSLPKAGTFGIIPLGEKIENYDAPL